MRLGKERATGFVEDVEQAAGTGQGGLPAEAPDAQEPAALAQPAPAEEPAGAF